ncbi:uncharacterized protein LOC128285035 [Gossypium arboreum]|uniref:uncharacterized protein LOC128285035 n=1 Tax=Gossypium arboreum TaxID=29729 RepID=UPI0022F165DB|nr:uncharacterized protein LOC128285035 [Gossypium arboreum]
MKDTTVKSEARAPARAYVVQARENALAPDVVAGTFSLFDVTVYALIDPRSTHLYICTALVTDKKRPIKSIEFVAKVSNLLGQYVLVDKDFKNFPLRVQDCDFPVDLIFFPLNEFDVILDMDWLNLHDAIVNYKRK